MEGLGKYEEVIWTNEKYAFKNAMEHWKYSYDYKFNCTNLQMKQSSALDNPWEVDTLLKAIGREGKILNSKRGGYLCLFCTNALGQGMKVWIK